jgi:hypothetical protein
MHTIYVHDLLWPLLVLFLLHLKSHEFRVLLLCLFDCWL